MFALVFLAAAVWSALTALGLRHYAQLDREELIAVIRCERAYQKDADFTLLYAPIVHRDQGAKAARAFPMRGDRWAFGGAILRWKGWLQFMGAKTMYRPLWIQGYSGNTPTPSFHSLKEGIDPVWFFLDRSGESLPFVETGYYNSVSSRMEYGVRFYLYVTPTGFAVKKVISYFRDIS